MAPLLPGDALAGSRVGISVSQSPDLARLGLLEQHFRFTLGEITRAVLLSGGGIVYGGRIDPRGYTSFVATELQRYARHDRPLMVCLAWHEHRKLPLSELDDFRQYLGLFGRLVCLDPDGTETAPADGRGPDPEPVVDTELRRRALTGLRRYMGEHQRGRVFIGGRRTDYQGAVPGVIEEAAMCLRAGQPMYLAGGFGGATWEITRCLGVTSGDWLPPEQPAAPDDPGLLQGCRLLRQFAEAPEWSGLNNGLTDRENEWLATSHRPADIAALVSLGLGRLAQSKGTHDA